MMSHQTNGVGPGRSDDRKLFVGGLGRNITEKELKDYFGKYGDLENVSIKTDVFTGQSRGFAFILFKNSKTIDDLLAAGDHYIGNKKVDPKRVTVNPLYCKVFVGGLTSDISDQNIRDYFGQYGEIAELQAPFDKVKNQRKGFCFITFKSTEVVHEVLKVPKQVINGKEVDVKKVKYNPETMGSGGRGGRGGMFGGRGMPGYGAPTGYGPGYGTSYGDYSGYDSYGMYSGYGYGNAGGYGEGYNYTQPNYGGGKFRENQYQRHHPY
uniref:RRM domain-containing protein n=1 Tax=Graphocephala atropunctata TaxID=36148 RepID=A0A1B6KAZ8_9HEMI